ncbi:Hsp70 family protein [Pseudonocardia sp. N23]|uniref:Hsp70 family protein n=1 Tax=Pseudonocardia sp. N23 TaxID=1987376 RepID=UPI000BFB6A57|nr:Hsp70 family protein [Pseudonocardia sp. N23]GAY11841.1 molecular chaperone [Pseudonocardia sp. N23]
MSGWILSIDFGTTNTVAAVRMPGGEIRSVRLSSDADQMPSCVFVEGHEIVVGQPAASRAMSAPTRFEATPKRRIGDDTVRLDNRQVPVVNLVAAVLRQVATRAVATAGGTPPDQVVLTHPESWGARRREQLAQAAQLVMPTRLSLLSEPVAAASWYLRATRLPAGRRIAVFDFGGGTLDVAVLRTEPGEQSGFVIAASAGEDQLGGEHIDRRLLDWVDAELRRSGRTDIADRLESPDEVAGWLTLRDQVRAAKHALSEYPSAHIAVRTVQGTASLLITVEEFERIIAPDIDRAVALTTTVLADAGTKGPDDLAGFYLTGGTSLIPLVQRRLAAVLGRTPATLDDPKLVVALGAASAAAAAQPTVGQPVPGGQRPEFAGGGTVPPVVAGPAQPGPAHAGPTTPVAQAGQGAYAGQAGYAGRSGGQPPWGTGPNGQQGFADTGQSKKPGRAKWIAVALAAVVVLGGAGVGVWALVRDGGGGGGGGTTTSSTTTSTSTTSRVTTTVPARYTSPYSASEILLDPDRKCTQGSGLTDLDVEAIICSQPQYTQSLMKNKASSPDEYFTALKAKFTTPWNKIGQDTQGCADEYLTSYTDTDNRPVDLVVFIYRNRPFVWSISAYSDKTSRETTLAASLDVTDPARLC